MTNTDEALKTAMMQVAQAKVAEALGGDVLGEMIEAVMDHRDSSYGSRDNRTKFEKIVEDYVEDAVQAAVREQIAARRDEIIAAVAEAMTRTGADKFATTIVDAFATDDWRAEMKVTIDRD